MDTLQTLITAISTVGFPIIMCLIMGYYIMSTIKENTDAINNLCGKIDILLDRIIREESEDEEK